MQPGRDVNRIAMILWPVKCGCEECRESSDTVPVLPSEVVLKISRHCETFNHLNSGVSEFSLRNLCSKPCLNRLKRAKVARPVSGYLSGPPDHLRPHQCQDRFLSDAAYVLQEAPHMHESLLGSIHLVVRLDQRH